MVEFPLKIREEGGEKAYNTNRILLFICLLLYFYAGEIKLGALYMLGKFIPTELPSTHLSFAHYLCG